MAVLFVVAAATLLAVKFGARLGRNVQIRRAGRICYLRLRSARLPLLALRGPWVPRRTGSA